MYFDSLTLVVAYILGNNLSPAEEFMILVGEDSASEVYKLIDILNKHTISFFGAIYPRLLMGTHSYSKGFLIEKYEPIYSALVTPHLMNFKLETEDLQGATALILADGLSPQYQALIDTVFAKIGPHVTYIGGGAGFYHLQHKPCIFNKHGLCKNALYICIIKPHTTVAVAHGWQILAGPYTTMQSYDNVLVSLDQYPAFAVYSDVIEAHNGVYFPPSEFFSFAKSHPFGLACKAEDNLIIRDALSLNELGDIVCVANIPLFSELYILKGTAETLLEASRTIVENCLTHAPPHYTALLFDCISRAMFLEERFHEELNYIQAQLPVALKGVLSIGEISSGQNGQLIIHNKSTILGLIEK